MCADSADQIKELPKLLEIDCGNSLAKWRVWSSAGIGLQGVHGYTANFAAVFDVLSKAGIPLSGCRVVSVAQKTVNQQLEHAWRRYSDRPIAFAKVSSAVEGVQCGYADTLQLGVDRWLAVLAVSKLTRAPSIVLDAGTALTIDLLDSDKHHLGGYILPGVDLLLSALSEKTAIPGERIPVPGDLQGITPGRDTRSAIGNAIGMVFHSLLTKPLADLGGRADVFVTGGHAEIACRYMSNSVCVPDLVMDGLQWALPSETLISDFVV